MRDGKRSRNAFTPFIELQRRIPQRAMSGELPDFADEKPFEVIRSADETDGAFVRFVSTLHPAPDAEGSSPLAHPRWAADNRDEHVHPNQTETFRVRAGRYRVIYGETDRTLAEKGHVGEDGMPPFPAFAPIQNRYPGHAYISGMPIGLQKAIFTAVAPLGRMMGYL